jgi:hypothetical protein
MRLRSHADAIPGPRPVDFLGPPSTPELWRLYEESAHSYGCTREFLEHFDDPTAAVLARIAPAAGEAAVVLLYRFEGTTVRLMGRLYALPAEALAAFAHAVFARHPDGRRIETDFIDAVPRSAALGGPALAVREAIELRIALPGEVEAYEQTLDREFLKRMQYHQRRLARRHPATRITTLERSAIPRSCIADVVRLNRERRTVKGSVSVFSARYEDGIARVARAHGQVTVLRDGEQVCAGVINIVTGPDAYFWVIGHASAYNRFSPGTLCLLASIRHCIACRVRTFHLLQGESEYKRAVGGKPAPLAAYVIVRSWMDVRPEDLWRLVVKHATTRARDATRAADRLAVRLRIPGEAPFTSLAREALRRVRGRP